MAEGESRRDCSL